MSYLFVLIHLVNLFYDNYFGNSNEVRIVYIYILVVPFIMMIICLCFEMMNYNCCVGYARVYVICMIDVAK